MYWLSQKLRLLANLGFSIFQSKIIVFLFLPTQLFALFFHIEGGSLESFDKELGKGFYHQIEIGHSFLSKKNLVGTKNKVPSSNVVKKNDVQATEYQKESFANTWQFDIIGGYFQNQKNWLPALSLHYIHYFGSGEFELWLGTMRKNYRSGFLLSHGGYNDLEKSPFWLRSPIGIFLHYRYFAFYLDGGYQKHLALYKEQQFFSVVGLKLFKDFLDVYAGFLYDFPQQKQTVSPLLGIEIGTKKYLFSMQWNRFLDIHSFLQLTGKNYGITAGYYQKKSHEKKQEHFSFGFFRDQTQAGYLRLRIYFFSASAKANRNYQRSSIKLGKSIDKWNGRAIYNYNSYSSKSASLMGIYITAPQTKVGLYGGFFWLLPKVGYQIVVGVGMAKIFSFEYNYVENWQSQFAPLNPLFFQNLVSNDLDKDILGYFPMPVQALSFAVEENGFSLLLRFVYSWTSSTILTRNISAKISYTKSF